MKKIVSILVLIVMLVGVATVVNASVNSDLASKLYSMGAKYGISQYKSQIDRYLADHELTKEQADTIIAQAEKAVALMEKEGATDYRDLSEDKLADLKSIAQVAASAINATLVLNSDGTVTLIDNETGDPIDTIKPPKRKAAYTGSNTNTVLVVSSIAGIALVAGIVARKKFANA